IDVLRLGIDLGMTHVDTAEMYGNGRVEQLVAEAIADRRQKVLLVSKVWPSNASYDGTLRACEGSLTRLGTDWLDLYLLHWPSYRYPIEETMRAMEKLVAEGMVKFIGVSNFDTEGLKAAQDALSDEKLACNQVQYHLGDRSIERDLLPYCAKRDIAIVGYSPFGHGNFPCPQTPRGMVLADISKRYNRTPRQIALIFLTRYRNVFTIPKSGRSEHIRENSGGDGGWKLKEEDISAIDCAFPMEPQ
ncbi:MAG: aldo/keto reductase, partial [Thermoproteota archaeon]|nr:aldo/keto reductase [Thermoproteota archaeon]